MGGGIAIFARYITDFDCEEKTSWWNVIKDTPFNIDELKSKRRYEIKKGEKNFDVKRVNYLECKEELFCVYEASKNGLPPYLQSVYGRSHFENMFSDLSNGVVFGAYSKLTGALEGFAVFRKDNNYIGFNSLKTNVDAEKDNVNFALIHSALEYFKNDLANGCYIDDGSRPVMHTTTNFQNFLEKYFLFRKAYSHLHIVYRPGIEMAVKLLYPFRNVFKGIKGSFFQQIYGILLQEEIIRSE